MNLPDLGFAFHVFFALVVLAVAVVVLRYLPRRSAAVVLSGLGLWVVYALAIGISGVASNYASMPPGVAILLVPVFAFVLATAFSPAGGKIAAAIPLAVLTGFQVFRVAVEFALAELNGLGLTPHLMTLEGGNFEILVAISAPLAAWASTRGTSWQRLLLGWNLLGLLSLANVASRAVLTAPGPLNLIHAEVPDLAIITYPFTSIPGFMAPLAVLLHILAIRSIVQARRVGVGERQSSARA